METKYLSNRTLLLFIAFLLMNCEISFSQDYATYNQWAKEAFTKKDYQTVIDYSTLSINLYPNGYAYWNRAAANYNSKNYSSASADYGNALSYYTDNESKGKLYFLIGQSNYYDDKDKEAMNNFINAESYSYSNKSELYEYLTNCAYNLYDNEKTISYGKLAINYLLDSASKSLVYSKMGVSEYALKNYDKSIDYLNLAISLNNNKSLAFKYRAYNYAKKYDYKNAFADMSAAINLEVENNYEFLSNLYENRAIYAYKLQDYTQCISDMVRATEEAPSIDGYWYMGLAHNSLNNYDKAIGAYNKAIDLVAADSHSTKATLYANKALIYKKQLNYTEALKWLNSSVNENKDYARAYWNRAIIQTNRKEWTSALNDYDLAISILQKDNVISSLVTLYIERAHLLIKLKDYDRANYDFQKSITLKPDNLEGLYNYGRFLFTSKKDEKKGRELLQECIEKSKATNSSLIAYANAILKNSDEALTKMFERLDLFRTDDTRYSWELHNTSCIYALLGNTKKSLEYLDKSLEAKYGDFEHLIFDRDLFSLTNLPEYAAILTKYKVPRFPK